MYTTEELYQLYETRFSKDNFNATPNGLYDPVNHIMSMKGKRIRPLLLLLACDMFGGDVQQALPPAFAVEVFHNFTLVHDDIMDKADLRRGYPTVHKLYGTNAGILAGDVMLAYAYKYLTQIPVRFIPRVMNVFTQTAIEIFEGQQMDIDFETRNDVALEEYLKMVEYKTSVLLACCLQVGAVLGDADAKNQSAVYDFGLHLGVSFQIRDDLLDAFGEGEKVGKKIGGDILMNKKTYLLISTWNRADERQKKALSNLLSETNEARKIAGIKQLMVDTGAYRATVEQADRLYAQSLTALKTITVPEEKKLQLYTIAEKINQREY